MNKELGTLVLVSNENRCRVTDRIDFKAIGDVELRVKHHPVTVFSLSEKQLPDEQKTTGDNK